MSCNKCSPANCTPYNPPAGGGSTCTPYTPPVTYTVSYNANGGNGTPGSQTKTHGATITLSNTVPSRAGYVFLGWAASSSATSASYQPGGLYTANAGITLYAVWKAATYTVSYNANGGVGSPCAQVKTHDVTLTLDSTIPIRTGCGFVGWSTSSTAASATYSAGGNFTTNATTTLYAVWEVSITGIEIVLL